MSIESFSGKSARDKTDERLVEVNQALESVSEDDEKEELVAEQISLKKRQEELLDTSHDEELEEDSVRDQSEEHGAISAEVTHEHDEIDKQLAELEAKKASLQQRRQELANDVSGESATKEQEVMTSGAPEKDIVQEQEPQEVTIEKADRVQAQQERETRDQEETQKLKELRQKLNIPETNTSENKERKMGFFERRVEMRKKEMQNKIEELTDENINNILSSEDEEGTEPTNENIEHEILTLKHNLEFLSSYQRMKKNPFWKHALGKLFDGSSDFSSSPMLFGTIGASTMGLGEAATIGGVAAFGMAMGPALVVGAGVGVALAAGVRTFSAINKAHNERKHVKANAKRFLN